MAGPQPSIAAFDEGTRLGALRNVFTNPRFILEQVGALTTAETMAAFRDQRLGNVKWPSRGETGMNPNWPGIIKDFTQGRSAPPSHRFDDRPALVDKGFAGGLQGSFRWRIISQDTVEVGTMKRYADALHAGDESETDPLTRTVQGRIWNWIKGVEKDTKNALSAPTRRVEKGVRQAVKDDPQVKALAASIAASKQAWAGQKVPAYERQRRQRLEARLQQIKLQVGSAARGAAAAITPKEGARISKAIRINTGAQSLRWLLNKNLTGQTITIKHPARPMVGVPKTLVEKIEALVGVKVRAA